MKKITLLLPLLLLATACVSSRSATAPSVEPLPSITASPVVDQEAAPFEPLPTKNNPTVFTSSPQQLAVNPNKTFITDGLNVEILRVQILSTGVSILVEVENTSDKPVRFLSALSVVTLGSQQLEYSDVVFGDFSSEIYPGVIQEGRLLYIPVDSDLDLDPQENDTLRWIVRIGAEDIVTELNLRPSSQAPLETPPLVSAPSSETFNAEIFDPPSNCRTGASVNSSVKQVLQRGDVLVDRTNTRSDDKGGIWYREKYLDCWIHESQFRFK